MPKVKRSRKPPPEGWELIEPTLEELDQKMREHSNKLSDRVNFLIGDNENLNINSHFDQEIFHSGVMEGEDVEEDLEKDMKCLDIGVESSGHVITKGMG